MTDIVEIVTTPPAVVEVVEQPPAVVEVVEQVGPPGPQGATGPPGPPGAAGATGAPGTSILTGTGPPADSLGKVGDCYIDTDKDVMYGPKLAAGSYGAAVEAFPSQVPDASYAGAYTIGGTLKFNSGGRITALRYYRSVGTMTASRTLRVWNLAGTQLAQAQTSGEIGTGWIEAALATPLTVAANQQRIITYDLPVGTDYYCYKTSPVPETSLVSWVEGRFITSPGQFPTTVDAGNHYMSDVSFEPLAASSWLVAMDADQWTQMTQAAYDALATKDPNMLYVIVG